MLMVSPIYAGVFDVIVPDMIGTSALRAPAASAINHHLAAAAALYGAGPETDTSNFVLFPAHAFTEPYRLPFGVVRNAANGCQPIESLACHVDC